MSWETASKTVSNGRSGCTMGAGGLANRWLNTRRDILYNILYGGLGFTIDLGVICYKLKMAGISLCGSLRGVARFLVNYVSQGEAGFSAQIDPFFATCMGTG